MSHQGHEGWFPECLVCGQGNVGPIVCLDPTCHERHEAEPIEAAQERLVRRDGHAWKECHWCARAVLADGGAWGSYALCVECWNRWAGAGELPPSRPPRQNPPGGAP